MSIQFKTRTSGIKVDPTTLYGACCQDSNCTEMAFSACPASGLFYPGLNCGDPNPCDAGANPRAYYGVCCDINGFCDVITEEECECRNGTWKGNDFDCLSYDCCAGSTAGHQACCRGNFISGVSGDYSWSGVCEDLKPCECLNLGGVPRGPLSTCSEINSSGGCGVTGATAHGSCCVTGNCLSPDTKHPNGYTAGDCATLHGLWGGSGSVCNDGTTFSNSWPCSWPTGSCCFGHHPFNGITYCDSGKTCGDCLNDPPGGSGGLAWISGATCGPLVDINGIGCIPPTGSDIGTCCIPEYFGVEDPDTKPFIVDYKCYTTPETRCISLGGLWDNKETDCEEINCCGVHGDCTHGGDGACCQFNINSGEFVSCSDTSMYYCEQIASNNKNITTLFHIDESCDNETGYPCKDVIFTTDSCCLWQIDGTYIGCQNIGENDPCPPTDLHLGIRFDQPCQSPGFNCSAQEIGACCHDSVCSFTSRGQCAELDGVFYEGLNCVNDCNVVGCCNINTETVIAGYNKDNKPITESGVDGCLDSFSVSSHLDIEFASDYLIDFGIKNAKSVYFAKNPNLYSCEDCDCPYSRNRGSCCWDGKCVPSITQDECRQLGGVFQGCEGKPFDHISQSWRTENPCIDAGCSDPEKRLGEDGDCGEDTDCLGACCSGDGNLDYCPPRGDCSYVTESTCLAIEGGCFYGCDTTCCDFATPPATLACCYSTNTNTNPKCKTLEDGTGNTAIQQCGALNGLALGYGTDCDTLHRVPIDDDNSEDNGVCSSCYSGTLGNCCYDGGVCVGGSGKNECLWEGGCWQHSSNGSCLTGNPCGFQDIGGVMTRPTECDDYYGDLDGDDVPEDWPPKIWGACCNHVDGTCMELIDGTEPVGDGSGPWGNMTAESCDMTDGYTWKPRKHCGDAGCDDCISCDRDPCPDCRPCCMAVASTDWEEMNSGEYQCWDMLPDVCIDFGGIPQYMGTKCSDEGIRITNENLETKSYNQGEYYCNYCGYKFNEFGADVDYSSRDATNLGAACTSCCGPACENGPENCSCCPLPTRQQHFDAEQAHDASDLGPCNTIAVPETGPCTINISPGPFCQREHNKIPENEYYKEEEWCNTCQCEAEGACCFGCTSTSHSIDWTPCANGFTREECEAYNDDSLIDQRGTWMGPGSSCPYECDAHMDDYGCGASDTDCDCITPGSDSCCCPDGATPGSCIRANFDYCKNNVAPCCSCSPWPFTQDPPGTWGNDCPNGIPGGGNCCDQNLGPGHGPAPWTGTMCEAFSLYDINMGMCINRVDGSAGHVGKFGTACARNEDINDADDEPYGNNCRTCDMGAWGIGACCQCHRWANNYPHHEGTDCGHHDHGTTETGDCGYWGDPEGQCYLATKHECDLMNKYNNPEGGGVDWCEQWDGSPFTIWKYPECNSYAGVHGVGGIGDINPDGGGAGSEVMTWTWHEGKPVGTEWTAMMSMGGLTPCDVDSPFYTQKGCNLYAVCGSSNRPWDYDDVWGLGYLVYCAGGFVGTGPYELAGSCEIENGTIHGDAWTTVSLFREWSTPWCHPSFAGPCKSTEGGYGLFGNDIKGHDYENIGTPLKQDGWCDGDWERSEFGCGTGCPHCRVNNFPSSAIDNMHQVVHVGHYRNTEDCKQTCPTFGACCNLKAGTCARWPERECLLMGGLYLGDTTCGNFGCPCDDYMPNTDEFATPFPAFCGCTVCSAFQSDFRDKTNDIVYEKLLLGRTDNTSKQFSVPFFGFVNVQTSPIDIPTKALPPIDNSKNILYWKISGDDVSKSMMIDIPFPTDPTSYQYIRGYVNGEHGNQNNLYWGSINSDKFKEYKESISQLWITRKYQTPENIKLAHTFEPYYHSKVEFAQVPNLKKLVLNPARYGNGRNEFNEEQEWLGCTDMVGYYIGKYLSKDMENSGPRGSKVKTLIAEDSSIDSAICTPMQYLNTSQLKQLNTLHVNNNDLYRLDISRNNNIIELWAEDNSLGSNKGTKWIDSDGYPNSQENFPMYRLDKIQRIMLSNNDIKSLETQSVRFSSLVSLTASNNKSMNNENKLHLVAPSLEYLDLSGCGLGAGIILESVTNLKQLILRDMINLGSTDDIDDGHFQFTIGTNKEMSNLEALVLTKSQLKFLNLGTSSQKEWGESGVVGVYSEYGNKFLNLKYIDLSDNHRMSKILLPKPSEIFALSGKEYIEYINVSRTAIGENIDEFFSQSAILHPNAYPLGHSLEISARNITDLNGNKITLSLDKYKEIVNNWDGSGKFIILDVDIDK